MQTAPSSWQELTLITAGKLLLGEVIPTAVPAADLQPPFDALPALLAKGLTKTTQTRIVETIKASNYNEALDYATRVKRIPADWPNLLSRAAHRYHAAKEMRRMADQLESGEELDTTNVYRRLQRLEEGVGELLVPLDQIKPTQYNFVKTGYAPLDDHLGGVPQTGVTLIGGPPGTGKTSLLIEIAKCFVQLHKKAFAIFSMEMTMQQFAHRVLQTHPLDKKYHGLIRVNDELLPPNRVASISSRVKDVGAIGIDFAELMLAGGDVSQAESTMASIYLTLTWLSKELKVPVFLLAQLNRANYTSGLPTLAGFRNSGMAEILASLALLIYNPNQIFLGSDTEESVLPAVQGAAYLIAAKSRYGFGAGSIRHRGPGAIQIAFDGKSSWGTTSTWFDLKGYSSEAPPEDVSAIASKARQPKRKKRK